MNVFISYCDDDGLGFAADAAVILEQHGHTAWYFDRDKSTGILRTVDITNQIRRWCDKVLYLCTNGSNSSEGQWKEIGQWDNATKQIMVIPIDGSTVPDVIDPYVYNPVSSSNFKTEFDAFVQNSWEDATRTYEEWTQKISINSLDTKIPIPTDEPTRLSQIQDIAESLNKNQQSLNKNTINEFNRSVWKGYLESALIRNIVKLAEASIENIEDFKNLVIYKSGDLDKYNAPDYHWGFAFRQLGREIAMAEKRELIRIIQQQVRRLDTPCSETNDELSIVQHEIERLRGIGHIPTIILAPPSMLKSFVHFFTKDRGKLEFTHERGSSATLEIKGLNRMRIYLLGGGILQDNIIILNGADIQWNMFLNPNTHHAVTMGIGIGAYPDKVRFIVGTTIKCVVQVQEGISIIPIER